jgi:hypothetical protein
MFMVNSITPRVTPERISPVFSANKDELRDEAKIMADLFFLLHSIQ